ncbi:WhiB family transcriptional regulator [Nocardia gipuzkoensis]
MAVTDWRTRGLCTQPGANPEAWYVENLPTRDRDAAAARLCDGCPVLKDCAMDAIQPIDMTAVLGTDEPPDVIQVSGVVRAGVPT